MSMRTGEERKSVTNSNAWHQAGFRINSKVWKEKNITPHWESH